MFRYVLSSPDPTYFEKSSKRGEEDRTRWNNMERNETRRGRMVRKKTDQDVTERDVTRCDEMESRRRTEKNELYRAGQVGTGKNGRRLVEKR